MLERGVDLNQGTVCIREKKASPKEMVRGQKRDGQGEKKKKKPTRSFNLRDIFAPTREKGLDHSRQRETRSDQKKAAYRCQRRKLCRSNGVCRRGGERSQQDENREIKAGDTRYASAPKPNRMAGEEEVFSIRVPSLGESF